MRFTSVLETLQFFSVEIRRSTLRLAAQSRRRWRRGFLSTFTVVAVVAAACSGASGTSTEVAHGEADVAENVSYHDGRELDVYLPQSGEDWPMVLLFHGNPPPSRGPLAPLAETLASRDVLVMNVGWRSDTVAWNSIAEIGCAVRFARSRAAEYGGDSSRITVVGYSAGATASAAVALAGDQFGGNCTETDGSPFPDAFVGIAGFYAPEVTPNDARSRIKESDPVLYQLLNPMSHLGRNLELEVALVHGSDDRQAPVETSTQFHEALTASGYETSLTILDGLGHGDVLDSASLVETILEVATGGQASSELNSSFVLDGKGLGDPSIWSWHVLDESPGEMMSDGRQLYRVDGWPDPLALSASPDGVTWQSIFDMQVLSSIERMTFSNGHGMILLSSLVESGSWDGVATDPPTVISFDPAGRVETGELRPQLPDPLRNYASVEVSAAAVGPNGAVIWTRPSHLDEFALARAAFGNDFTTDLEPDLYDAAIHLVRISEIGSVEDVMGPVRLTDLGIDDNVLRESSVLWHSTDGESWRSVPAPDFLPEGEFDGSEGEDVEMVGIDDGFLLVYEDEFVDDIGRIISESVVMYSPDGIAWEEIDRLEHPWRKPVELVPWRDQALVWDDNDFWQVTSEGVERLGLSEAPALIEDWSHLVGAGEAGIVYLYADEGGQLEIVYSPDGHAWSRAPLPQHIAEVIDIESVSWSGPPVVGREAVLLESTPTSDRPHTLLQTVPGSD